MTIHEFKIDWLFYGYDDSDSLLFFMKKLPYRKKIIIDWNSHFAISLKGIFLSLNSVYLQIFMNLSIIAFITEIKREKNSLIFLIL